jgi:NAD(P)-dependent dehydrogenase (short-subunit alcohol dehydrogenase family)
MDRISVVTGAASGIGAATAQYLRGRGGRVITSDLHDADVVADLATPEGRAALVDGVTRLCGGRLDAIVANAGGGPPETMVQLNFFGAVATLDGLRPLLAASPAPRAVAVSSIASLRPPDARLVGDCLKRDEASALVAARALWAEVNSKEGPLQAGIALYANAKLALNRWCRAVAATPAWAGAGVVLNAVALGFYDTPAAAYVLSDPQSRAAMGAHFPLRGAYPGRPEEAAALLAWLTSAENTQLTGQILFADGGFEARARGAAA